jgi:hypothetical protein
MTLLHEWESFYVIVGSSSAALIGLQFVVIALVADIRTRSTTGEIDAFASPTIVHFGGVLLLSGILSAPWRTPDVVAWLLGACGLGGLIYTAIVTRRVMRQGGYSPVVEDWLFHAVVPGAAYVALAVAGVELASDPEHALFAIGTAAMLLMFVGIHNAWDAVTYIVLVRKPQEEAEPPASRPPSAPAS